MPKKCRNTSRFGLFFALRIGCALILLKLAASRLSVAGFADFSQYLAFASLMTLLAVGGSQNGLIRQVAAARDRADLEETLASAEDKRAGAVLKMAQAEKTRVETALAPAQMAQRAAADRAKAQQFAARQGS